MRPVVTYRMRPTAPNDSQKPGASTAHGSITSTANNAALSTTDAELRRPLHNATATTASMYTVRCAGTAKPASQAYASAVNNPATAAALRAGKRSVRRTLRRHNP